MANKQLIEIVRTHADIFVGGGKIGSLGTTLPPAGKTFKRLEMSRTNIGSVLVDVEDLKGNKAIMEIPAGNIMSLQYGRLIETLEPCAPTPDKCEACSSTSCAAKKPEKGAKKDVGNKKKEDADGPKDYSASGVS